MTAAPASLVVVGAINVDFVVAAHRLPRPGETVVGDSMRRHGGGKGANAAIAAARAGAKVRLIGAVGDDDTGRVAVEELRAEGIDVDGVAVLDDVATGVALIVVDANGENQIAVGAGANAAVTSEQVIRSSGSIKDAECVLVSTEVPGDAVVAAVRVATGAGVRCVLNPAPVIPEVLAVLELGPVLTPNSSEMRELLALLDGADAVPKSEGDLFADVAEGARRIVARTGAPVVTTLGSEGALVVTPEGAVDHLPPRPVRVRDTTGAGDTFNGVLAAWLAAGAELPAAVRAASAAASLSVGQVGARTGMPRRESIEAALRDG